MPASEMKLLIVDDSQAVRQFMRSFLAPMTTDVQECDDGASALASYQAFLPDFVLMDLEMKTVNGLQATSQITAIHPEAKIIIMTNFDDALLRAEAHRAGATAYVVKEHMAELPRILQGLPSLQNLF